MRTSPVPALTCPVIQSITTSSGPDFGVLSPPEARLRDRTLAANGIRTRHYAVDGGGQTLMLNEELAATRSAARWPTAASSPGRCACWPPERPRVTASCPASLRWCTAPRGGPMELLSASGCVRVGHGGHAGRRLRGLARRASSRRRGRLRAGEPIPAHQAGRDAGHRVPALDPVGRGRCGRRRAVAPPGWAEPAGRLDAPGFARPRASRLHERGTGRRARCPGGQHLAR